VPVYPDNVDYTTFPPSLSLNLEGRIYAGGAADLDISFTTISGPRAVAEHVARRLISPPGSYDDPDWGFDVNSWLNANLLPQDLDAFEAAVRNEVLDVEGVDDAEITTTLDATVGLVCVIELSLTEADSFELVFVLGADTIPRIYFPVG
jgi:hypothetical protein